MYKLAASLVKCEQVSNSEGIGSGTRSWSRSDEEWSLTTDRSCPLVLLLAHEPLLSSISIDSSFLSRLSDERLLFELVDAFFHGVLEAALE
jgi:hypothetical protein